MFNKTKGETLSPLPKTYAELQIEVDQLKVDCETAKYRLKNANEQITYLENTIKDLRSMDACKLRNENLALTKKIERLEFEKENDTSSIELKTENEELKSKVQVLQNEVEYLKNLLENYRTMPEIQNMIKSLSQLAVPNIEELREFSKVVSDSQIGSLCATLNDVSNKIDCILRSSTHYATHIF